MFEGGILEQRMDAVDPDPGTRSVVGEDSSQSRPWDVGSVLAAVGRAYYSPVPIIVFEGRSWSALGVHAFS